MRHKKFKSFSEISFLPIWLRSRVKQCKLRVQEEEEIEEQKIWHLKEN